ncbi:hypothetical protein [Halalkalibacter alkaliphilus]|uniref:Flagellar hook-length control protein-like C-terminal domain-containing protein n=1 Tax=Halalkalibacter alkaliphilus TaxID=2917993 RepID=A0A9X2CS19_9BACI|nr:hypothetical protein [Halalkalibacter alkaliphilus]MCL7747147.1 hypothetical protein [Halalkalibacter alkaliphilus]
MVQIQQSLHTTQQSERPIQLREGDVYRVTVKEQKGNNEALLSVRGREVAAKFDGRIPSGERTTVQVLGSEADRIRVRVLHDEGGRGTQQAKTHEKGHQQGVTQTLRQLGIQQPTPELRQAAAIVLDKGVALSKEAVRDLQKYMNEGQSDLRIQTVQALANKRLEVTSVHLRAIHETLHGRPINSVLTDLAKEIDRDFKVDPAERERLERPTQAQAIREVRQNVHEARTVEQASEQVERRLIQSGRVSREQAGQLERVTLHARTDAASGQERTGVERMIQALEHLEREARGLQDRGQAAQTREGNGSRIVDQITQVRNEIPGESIQRAAERVQHLANLSQIDREFSRSIDRAVTESRHLDQISNERLIQSLQQAERSTSNEGTSQALANVRQQIVHGGLTHSVSEKIETIIRQMTSSDAQTSHQLSKSLRQAIQLQNVANDRLQQALNAVEQSIKTEALSKEKANENLHANNLREATKEAETTLRREASLERAIQKVDSLLSGHPVLTAEEQNKFRQSISEAREWQQQGRELKSRQEIAKAIEDIKQINQLRPQETTTYTQNEAFQTSVDMASKSIAVTTVTEKMAQMASDFKKLQRDITRNLDLVNRQIEQFRSQAQPQAKPLLETTIKNLDNAILKSEMMLLSDMKTERQLMLASSQLAEAKKLLARGKYREANEIVRNVKQQVERLQFQPSETRVKHYTAANEQALRELQTPNQSFRSKYTETARGPVQEGSPRAMFEMVRNAGLNRDSEIAMQLASGREQHESSERNLKSILMQLARGEEEGSRVQQLANQALSNVTGQQLLSRSEQQSNLQSLYFQLPLLLEDKVENLQVYVNSRNEGQQVDWENCSLYFLMETPKMGEIGIVVSAAERQLSITLKNNKADFQQKMKPLVGMAVTKLSEIGYSINGINYSQLNNKSEESADNEGLESPQQPVFGEKGFDYKI